MEQKITRPETGPISARMDGQGQHRRWAGAVNEWAGAVMWLGRANTVMPRNHFSSRFPFILIFELQTDRQTYLPRGTPSCRVV